MLLGLGRYIVREFRSQRSAVFPLWLPLAMFLCYLVLLKAHLKISWLCKWALRRLKKGVTGLRWAIHIAAGKGEAFTARHWLGWNVAFFTNSSGKQLPPIRDYRLFTSRSVNDRTRNSCFPSFRTSSFVSKTESGVEVLLFCYILGYFCCFCFWFFWYVVSILQL